MVKIVVEKEGKKEEISCDRLLIAVGRRALTKGLGLEDVGAQIESRTGQVVVDEHYRTNIPHIYAVGDMIAGPMLAHKAAAEGIAAVECMANREGEVNYDCIPAIVYTWPEVASVGMTEEQLKERHIPYRSATYLFAGNGRARCLGERDGLAKILAHERTGRVLGVHILGPRACELISECVLGMELGCSVQQIAHTIHGHPTFSEVLQEAAMAMEWKKPQ
jgi:dihydrolipoamide dehydrogenase